jgi:WD40 repeat protein/tRNA A-37 threonylcarbamoyl transferase component Bud32
MSIPSVISLLDVLRQHHILEPVQLDELTRCSFPDQPRALAAELIRRGWLTPYQANQILQGRAGELVLGSYVLLERLGEGGMGTVFKGRNWKLGRVVALKLIRKERLANADAVRRFHREIRITAQLAHPNIVLAYDADEVNGTHMLIMEYVEGHDLDRLVRQHGPLPIASACDYIRQAALGLQHAHEKGLVHRDIKPANLLLSKQGVVKILDLGLAQLGASEGSEGSSTLTQEGMVMGTLDYIAPEQAADSHAVDIRADLYSLGCSLYFLLTGSVPFPSGKPVEKLYRHRYEEPVPVQRLRSDVPPAVAFVVRKLMAKQPDQRFQTPAELAAALAPEMLAVASDFGLPDAEGELPATVEIAAAGGLFRETGSVALTEPEPGGTTTEPTRPQNRWPRLLLGGVGLLLLLGIGLLVYSFVGQGSQPKVETGPGTTRKPEVREARVVLKEHTGPVLALAFAPNGVGNRSVLASGSQDGTIRLWNLAGGPSLATLKSEHAAPVRALTFPADGKSLISAAGRTIHVWDPVTGTESSHLDTGHPTTVRALAVEPFAPYLLETVGDDNAWRWWAIAEEKQVGVRYQPVEAWSVACSPPHLKRFAVGLANGTVHCSNHAMKDNYEHSGHRGPVKVLLFSPTGKLLASGGADGVIKLWDAVSGKEEGTLQGHKGEVRGLAFSPDGKVLASASADGTVRLWGVLSGKERAVLQGHPGGVGAVAFSPDGKTLASGEFDGTVRLWDVPPADALGR